MKGKQRLKELSVARALSKFIWKLRNTSKASVSRSFWERRYSDGGTSGPGSYGQCAEFKSATITKVLELHAVNSVIDFGCGDGNQIRELSGIQYSGIDVSADAVERCRSMYAQDPDKTFMVAEDYKGETAELAMSLDVIFHLVEDEIYESYMGRLFRASEKLVLIYSSNFEQLCFNPFRSPTHVRHRKFTDWVNKKAPGWRLAERISNPYRLTARTTPKTHSFADFYLFLRE